MNLFYAVQQAKNKDEVVQAVRQWFKALPQPESRTLSEDDTELWRGTAELFRPETPQAGLFDCPALLEQAKRDRNLWEGLRRYALDQAEAGEPILPDLAVVLLTDTPPVRKQGRQRGQAPLDNFWSGRYARAVWCVYHGSSKRYKLSNNSTNPDNAYEVVAEATRATFDVVRNAAKEGMKRIDFEIEHFSKMQNVNKSDVGRCE